MVSVILPFRERHFELERMMQSLIENSSGNCEVLIAIDSDDKKTIDSLNRYFGFYKDARLSFFLTPKSDNFSKDYYNRLARMAQGRWILPINDDCVFRTAGWDKIIDEKMSFHAEKAGNDILLGFVSDGQGIKSVKTGFCCFPVVSRQYVSIMDGIFDERCYMWGADHVINELFNKLYVGQRKVDLQEVLIDHLSVHAEKGDYNDNHKRFCKIHDDHKANITQSDFEVMIKKIKTYVNL